MVLARGMFEEWLKRCRESRQLVVVIVAIALLLDNMLLTTVGKCIEKNDFPWSFDRPSHRPGMPEEGRN